MAARSGAAMLVRLSCEGRGEGVGGLEGARAIWAGLRAVGCGPGQDGVRVGERGRRPTDALIKRGQGDGSGSCGWCRVLSQSVDDENPRLKPAGGG